MTSVSLNELKLALNRGEFIIVHDPHREAEGDFFLLAEHATSAKINYLMTHARGMICVALSGELCDQMELPMMVPVDENTSEHGTNFCVLVDAKKDTTTGVSAFDRAQTILQLADKRAKRSDFVMPGHTAPLRAMVPDKRFGHTEAAVELAKSAGARPAVVICEIMNTAGYKASRSEQEALAAELNCLLLDIGTLKKLLGY